MAIFDLSQVSEAEKAFEYVTELTGKEKKVEIKQYSPKRSNPQNRSLHLLLGYMSNETGYTLEECKQLYKEMNRGIYTYTKETKDGEHLREFTRSSADLTQAEMAKTIDKLYKVCAENGIELPLLTNEAYMREIELEIERNGHYN